MCTVSIDQHYQPCLPFRLSVHPTAVILSDMSRNGCDWMHPSTHPQSSLVHATTNCNSVSRPVHHSSSLHIIVLCTAYYGILYQSWCRWKGCACYRSEATHDTKLEIAVLQHGGHCHKYKQPFHAEQECPTSEFSSEAARCISSCEHLWHVIVTQSTPCRVACEDTEAGCIQ